MCIRDSFYITKDEEGENLEVGGVANQTKDKSQIYYKATKSDKDVYKRQVLHRTNWMLRAQSS